MELITWIQATDEGSPGPRTFLADVGDGTLVFVEGECGIGLVYVPHAIPVTGACGSAPELPAKESPLSQGHDTSSAATSNERAGTVGHSAGDVEDPPGRIDVEIDPLDPEAEFERD